MQLSNKQSQKSKFCVIENFVLYFIVTGDRILFVALTLNIPSLGRQRCLPSWVPRRTPCFFL